SWPLNSDEPWALRRTKVPCIPSNTSRRALSVMVVIVVSLSRAARARRCPTSRAVAGGAVCRPAEMAALLGSGRRSWPGHRPMALCSRRRAGVSPHGRATHGRARAAVPVWRLLRRPPLGPPDHAASASVEYRGFLVWLLHYPHATTAPMSLSRLNHE